MPGEPVMFQQRCLRTCDPAAEGSPLISLVEDEPALQVVVHRARDAAAGVAALDGELPYSMQTRPPARRREGQWVRELTGEALDVNRDVIRRC